MCYHYYLTFPIPRKNIALEEALTLLTEKINALHLALTQEVFHEASNDFNEIIKMNQNFLNEVREKAHDLKKTTLCFYCDL